MQQVALKKAKEAEKKEGAAAEEAHTQRDELSTEQALSRGKQTAQSTELLHQTTTHNPTREVLVSFKSPTSTGNSGQAQQYDQVTATSRDLKVRPDGVIQKTLSSRMKLMEATEHVTVDNNHSRSEHAKGEMRVEAAFAFRKKSSTDFLDAGGLGVGKLRHKNLRLMTARNATRQTAKVLQSGATRRETNPALSMLDFKSTQAMRKSADMGFRHSAKGSATVLHLKSSQRECDFKTIEFNDSTRF